MKNSEMDCLSTEMASELSELMVRHGEELDAFLRRLHKEDPDCAARVREPVSRLLTVMLIEVMNPLYATFPELRPDDLR